MQLRRKSLLTLAIVLMSLTKSAHPQGMDKSVYPPQPLVVLISEILFDPEPVIGLPSKEYIELYNNSNDTINLFKWILRVGDKSVSLPSMKLAPKKFVLLTSKLGKDEFLYLNIDLLSPDTWPVLKNSGQFIVLLSPSGNIVHFVKYHPSQFEDILKKDGGWSLELGDINAPCSFESWLPSVNFLGGTPGNENSTKRINYQTKPPKVLRLGILDRNRLIVELDRPVLPLLRENWFQFEFEPVRLEVTDWNYFKDQPWVIELILDNNIPPDQIISLRIMGEAHDCKGYNFYPDTLQFGLPDDPISGDVVISEILFDPLENQAEFVGIHNRSDKVLALNELYLATCDESGNIARFSKPNEESFLMLPGKEYVLTSDALPVRMISDRVPHGQVCERADFPSLPNTGSGIILMDKGQTIIDKVNYESDWHRNDIGETKGISLERISLDLDGMDANNWHSASFISGGSTPGLLNSQSLLLHDDTGLFNIESKVFSPNNDGLRDVLLVCVSINETGWKGKAEIWNFSGNKVRELMDASILPAQGYIKWDGCNQYGKLSSPGYYAIIINYIRPDGSRGRWKEACLLQ